MTSEEMEDISRKDKLNALRDVARYRPRFTAAIITLGLIAAALEGIGLGFILPIIELVQASDSAAEADGIMSVFVTVYQAAGVPLTLGTAILGVSLVMAVRYTSSFTVGWLRAALQTYYVADLQDRAFQKALNAQVSYYDEEGSNDILNAIITQTDNAGRVIQRGVQLLQQVLIATVYFIIAMVIAPVLTILTITVLGGFSILFQRVLESGYDLGDQVAVANEQRQAAVQAGTQGIRDIRLFGVADELYRDFRKAIENYTVATIRQRRNSVAIKKFYNLVVSVSVFVLIYFALTFADLLLGEIGLFLFAMFRLGPKVSNVNGHLYQVLNDIPHLVRTLKFFDKLDEYNEPNNPTKEVPDAIERIEFDDVWFSYDDDEEVLRGIDLQVRKGEFVAFVGQSGAGKSTIASLIARMYEVERGDITVNDVPIRELDIHEWRDNISVVRQSPFIFNKTLRYNLTIGKRDTSDEELDRVCEITKVDEFIHDLPNGYDTVLGDQGVKLSGGQKQRVALARALIKDADLLILDEATSDLDSNLEKQIQRSVEQMDRDYAIISIAHRLSTVQNADRIYTLEEGRITERGSHQDLIENDEKYAELFKIQSSV